MTNQYYASPADLAPGTKARAGDINTIDQSVDAAFDKLPAELALKSGTVNYAVNKSNQANAYAVDLAAAVTAYADGLEVKMKPGSDNTGAATLNVNGLGAIAIKRQDGSDVQAGDLVGASPITLVYSGGSNSFRLPPLANAQVTQAAASATAAANSAGAAANAAGAASGYANVALQARNDANTAATNAGNSATAASTSAGNAATSAGQASGSAQSAATSAANLATALTTAAGSATAASNSAAAANTSAGNAATSATASATSATQSATSATNSANSATAAATSAGNANGSAQSAASSALAATNTANQLQTAVAASASSAQSSAQQAGVARDAAIAAWQASTAPTEQLAAISKLAHQGAVVDVFLYDTSRDSDGGAWRRRCKHTTWENEALAPGKWLGQIDNTVAAVAAGGQVGDYFQAGPSYSGSAFFQITSTGNASAKQIYRGNTREFPALALIVAEASRLVIYDATKPDLPMWMVFIGTANAGMVRSPIATVVMVNSQMFVGYGSNQALTDVRFTADDGFLYWVSSTYAGYYAGRIGERNNNKSFIQPNSSRGYLINQTVTDCSAAVLSDAPIDPMTGLPVPTVAVATLTGMTVLKQDSTAVSSGSVQIDAVRITKRNTVQYGYYGHSGETDPIPLLTAGFGNANGLVGASTGFSSAGKTLDNPLGYMTKLEHDAAAGTRGILRIKRGNTAEKTMVTAITNAYNSGWQNGDTRGAWLADTAAETAIGQTEAVTNGTFPANTAGWTAGDLSNTGAATISVNAGRLRIANSIANYGSAYQKLTLVPGKTYTAYVDYFLIAGGYAAFRLGTTPNVYDVHPGTDSIASPGKGFITFVAPQQDVYLVLFVSSGAGSISEFDNVSVQPALVQNGTFEAGTSSWTSVPGYSSTAAAVSGELRVTATAPYGAQWQGVPTTPGKDYQLTVDMRKVSGIQGAYLALGNPNGSDLVTIKIITKDDTTMQRVTYQFTASAATTYVCLRATDTGTYANEVAAFDNISVKLLESDRSVKNKGLIVYGSIVKSPVAAGTQLAGYSGFSAINYLEQPYNADLDFGTGDFCVMGWVLPNTATAYLLTTEKIAASASYGLRLTYETGQLRANVMNHTGAGSIGTTLGFSWGLGTLAHMAVYRRSGVMYMSINGVPVAQAAHTEAIADGILRIGEGRASSFPLTSGFLALWRASATAPTDDQIAQIYRDELTLFQPGAQCAIAGNPTQQVTAIAYDDVADLLHVGTNWGYRSSFRGLQMVESQYIGAANDVGGVNALAAVNGALITGGSLNVRYAAPAVGFRDELRRRYEARQAMAREEIPIDFDGIAAQTAFTLPLGFTTKGVFIAGTKKRAGATKDYTTSYDGYRETVNFGVSPGATWVQITANRSM